MLLKTEQNVKTLNKTLQVDRFVLKFRTQLSYKQNKTLQVDTISLLLTMI